MDVSVNGDAEGGHDPDSDVHALVSTAESVTSGSGRDDRRSLVRRGGHTPGATVTLDNLQNAYEDLLAYKRQDEAHKRHAAKDRRQKEQRHRKTITTMLQQAQKVSNLRNKDVSKLMQRLERVTHETEKQHTLKAIQREKSQAMMKSSLREHHSMQAAFVSKLEAVSNASARVQQLELALRHIRNVEESKARSEEAKLEAAVVTEKNTALREENDELRRGLEETRRAIVEKQEKLAQQQPVVIFDGTASKVSHTGVTRCATSSASSTLTRSYVTRSFSVPSCYRNPCVLVARPNRVRTFPMEPVACHTVPLPVERGADVIHSRPRVTTVCGPHVGLSRSTCSLRPSALASPLSFSARANELQSFQRSVVPPDFMFDVLHRSTGVTCQDMRPIVYAAHDTLGTSCSVLSGTSAPGMQCFASSSSLL